MESHPLPEIIRHLDTSRFSLTDLMYNRLVHVEERRACARLARVCKAFTELALDALWSVQLGFRIVFTLLLQLKSSSEDKLLVVQDVQVQRLYFYTSRTKYFVYYNMECDQEYQPHILARVCRDRPLFPSLSYLRLDGTWPVTISEASLLFTHSLRTLDIGHIRNKEESWSKLKLRQQKQLCTHMLIRHCPPLQNLVFRDMHTLEMLRERDVEVLIKLADVVSVDLRLERYQNIQDLFGLPHLRSLKMAVGDAFKGTHDVMTMSPTSFHHLDTLNLRGKAQSISAMLRTLQSRRPRELVLSYSCPESPSINHITHSLDSLDRAVKDSLITVELVQVQHSTARSLDSEPFETNSLTAVIRPLFPSWCLETLHLRVSFSVSVSDSDIVSIASKLPRLHHLWIILHDHRESEHIQTLTIHGILELSTHCTMLQTLILPLDMENFGTVEGSVRPHNLKILQCYTFFYHQSRQWTEGSKIPRIPVQPLLKLFPRLDYTKDVVYVFRIPKYNQSEFVKWERAVMKKVRSRQGRVIKF